MYTAYVIPIGVITAIVDMITASIGTSASVYMAYFLLIRLYAAVPSMITAASSLHGRLVKMEYTANMLLSVCTILITCSS